ncbi:MAG TPA: FMN-binding protein [Clostridia bacterium]|nr:FMN-binding protein [Clostridia bacterium]
MLGWIIALTIIAVLGVGGTIGGSYLSKEYNEAKNLPLNDLDFSKLNDGTYIGEYEGGMYKWRVNKVQVIVTSGKVKDIKLLSTSGTGCVKIDPVMLYDRVIEAQSLQVDTVSGATLSSKAYLKSVENALSKAQKK